MLRSMNTQHLKHTLGPWTTKRLDPTHLVIRAGNRTVARMTIPLDMNLGEIKANVALIAAAPDLLDALVQLMVYSANRGINTGTELDHVSVKNARAAIAKAVKP